MTYEVDQNTILVSGRAGIIGCNLIGYALDKLTYVEKKLCLTSIKSAGTNLLGRSKADKV